MITPYSVTIEHMRGQRRETPAYTITHAGTFTLTDTAGDTHRGQWRRETGGIGYSIVVEPFDGDVSRPRFIRVLEDGILLALDGVYAPSPTELGNWYPAELRARQVAAAAAQTVRTGIGVDSFPILR